MTPMHLAIIILITILVGVALWAADTYIPMHPTVKRIVNFIVIIVLVLWLLGEFDLLQHITNFHLSK